MENNSFRLVIVFFILSLGIAVIFGFKNYNESYEYAVTTYTECLKIIYPEEEDMTLKDRAENDLKQYKGKDSLFTLKGNLTILKIQLEAQKANNEQIKIDFNEVFNLKE